MQFAGWKDYTETRAIVALVGLGALIVGLFTHFIEGSQFVTGLLGIVGCFTAHSLIDDKIPDRTTIEVINK